MKPYILLILLLISACSTVKQESPKQNLSDVKKEKLLSSGINALTTSQREQIKILLSEINLALDAYKTSGDSNDIAAKCNRVTDNIGKLLPSLPAGFLKNTLEQGNDALNLAYLFRYEKTQNIVISDDLRHKVVDFYKIGDISEANRADKLFDFAQAHFEIASRITSDAASRP